MESNASSWRSSRLRGPGATAAIAALGAIQADVSVNAELDETLEA
jgi:hypothetical protein